MLCLGVAVCCHTDNIEACQERNHISHKPILILLTETLPLWKVDRAGPVVKRLVSVINDALIIQRSGWKRPNAADSHDRFGNLWLVNSELIRLGKLIFLHDYSVLFKRDTAFEEFIVKFRPKLAIFAVPSCAVRALCLVLTESCRKQKCNYFHLIIW